MQGERKTFTKAKLQTRRARFARACFANIRFPLPLRTLYLPKSFIWENGEEDQYIVSLNGYEYILLKFSFVLKRGLTEFALEKNYKMRAIGKSRAHAGIRNV